LTSRHAVRVAAKLLNLCEEEAGRFVDGELHDRAGDARRAVAVEPVLVLVHGLAVGRVASPDWASLLEVWSAEALEVGERVAVVVSYVVGAFGCRRLARELAVAIDGGELS